jgi:ABC-type glycerol-3-phosphate transport system substrate-binding protein
MFPGRVLAGFLALALSALPAAAQQLAIWHDLGDNGTKWVAEVGAEFAKTHPGVTVQPISYPTDQWFGRSISALNTGTAPDLLFNKDERVIRVAVQTGKISDLRPVLAGIGDKGFLTDEDWRVATFDRRMTILPVQHVQMAFGVRRSWLEKVGEPFP